VIPAFILLMAFVLWRLWIVQAHWRFRIIPGILAAILLISYTQGSFAFWDHIEYEGAIKETAAFNNRLPDDAVILFERSKDAIQIALPLALMFGKTVLPVTESGIRTLQIRELVLRWRNADRPVYWISPKGTEIRVYGPVIPQGEKITELPEVAVEPERRPDTIRNLRTRLRIYQIMDTEFTFPINLDTNFNNQITLLGYQLDKSTAARGDTLHLDLYWYAAEKLSTDFTVFSHILDESVTIWGQKDSPPVSGTRPTSEWQPGEIVHDMLAIPISSDAPDGEYQLSIGLYDRITMVRLPIINQDRSPVGHLDLSRIQIKGAN
jgi:hypothetical protein